MISHMIENCFKKSLAASISDLYLAIMKKKNNNYLKMFGNGIYIVHI